MNPKTCLRLLGIPMLWLAAVSAWAQAPAPELTKKESDEIRYLARIKIENDLAGLLNTLSFEEIGVFERTTLIKNSFLPNTNQVFLNDEIILEDDIDPRHLSPESAVDAPVETYLRNFDLFYAKTPEPSIRFSNLVVDAVQWGNGFFYLKVFFTATFSSKHKQIDQPYQPTARVAELRAEKESGKWAVRITRLAFLRPGEGRVPPNLTLPLKPDADSTASLTPPRRAVAPAVAPEILALERQVARYRTKGILGKSLGVGVLVGGVVTFLAVNGAYSTYKNGIASTSTRYQVWYRSNYAGVVPDPVEARSLLEFGSPGIYVAAACLVGGVALGGWGIRNARLARQARQEAGRKRKSLTFTPFYETPNRLAGLHLRAEF